MVPYFPVSSLSLFGSAAPLIRTARHQPSSLLPRLANALSPFDVLMSQGEFGASARGRLLLGESGESLGQTPVGVVPRSCRWEHSRQTVRPFVGNRPQRCSPRQRGPISIMSTRLAWLGTAPARPRAAGEHQTSVFRSILCYDDKIVSVVRLKRRNKLSASARRCRCSS